VADDTSRFLSKGGVILGIAAYSHSRHLDCGKFLGPALFEPATRLLEASTVPGDIFRMAEAVRVATSGAVPVALTSLLQRCATDSALRAYVGDHVSLQWPPGSDSAADGAPAGAEGGLLALAISVCRNSDLIHTVAALVEKEAQAQFLDAAKVAAVLAAPGEPSRVRSELKSRVLAYDAGQTNAREALHGSSD
jgi:hypothetical protein